MQFRLVSAPFFDTVLFDKISACRSSSLSILRIAFKCRDFLKSIGQRRPSVLFFSDLLGSQKRPGMIKCWGVLFWRLASCVQRVLKCLQAGYLDRRAKQLLEAVQLFYGGNSPFFSFIAARMTSISISGYVF